MCICFQGLRQVEKHFKTDWQVYLEIDKETFTVDVELCMVAI